MNDENHEFDPKLEALFRREHTHLPAEPFSATVLRAISADRKRAARRRLLLQAAAVVAVILLSPSLIDGSIWLSTRLDELFAFASTWLGSPLGLGAAALCALVALATKWARVW